MSDEKMMREPGFAGRVALSILSFFGLIIFLVVWLFFYADGFTIYQNLAVVIVAFLAFIAVNGAAWASWGIKYGHKYEQTPRKPRKQRRRK